VRCYVCAFVCGVFVWGGGGEGGWGARGKGWGRGGLGCEWLLEEQRVVDVELCVRFDKMGCALEVWMHVQQTQEHGGCPGKGWATQ
jgi:hypothetical protein